MNDADKRNSLWLVLAGGYALLLAGAILAGTLLSMGSDERRPGNAVHMPGIAIVIALCLGVLGIGLFYRFNICRFLFLVAAPWGSLALGSAFAHAFWREDVPYTAVAIFAYVPLAFLLARGSTLRAAGAKDGTWLSRGGGLLLACAGAMLLARFAVVASKPSGGGSFYGTLVGLNEYVQRLVLCDVPLWNYVVAIVAVSIPTRFRKQELVQQDAQLAEDSGVPNLRR